jgi:hypothetical protein
MPVKPLDIHTYRVTTVLPGGASPLEKRVEAAYYKTENGFTTFKNDGHQDVYTVRDDCLITVERTDDPVDEKG